MYRRQTSIRSGMLLAMGKDFCATEGVLGRDLGDLIMESCNKLVSTAMRESEDSD